MASFEVLATGVLFQLCLENVLVILSSLSVQLAGERFEYWFKIVRVFLIRGKVVCAWR
jgi:hypothetical protein